MRTWKWMLLALAAAILSASTASAGIYNPGEQEDAGAFSDFMKFRDLVFALRSIPLPRPEVNKPIRRRYVFEDELLSNASLSRLKTIEDRLQASAVLIRRHKLKNREAEQILRPVAMLASEQDNIPLQSNFATTLHLAGDLPGAIATLGAIMAIWREKQWDELPEDRRLFLERIGWHQGLYEFYRDCDAAYLKLLRGRLRDQRAMKDAMGLLQPPDALFANVRDPSRPARFVDDNGEYTAGRIPDQLPKNALGVTQQLVVWFPDDYRLYWLLGDVYNAQGSESDKEKRAGIIAAHRIFTDLSIERATEGAKEQLKRRLGVLTLAVERFQREGEAELTKNLKKQETQDAGMPVDWRTVAVSFGAGFVLALGVVWQVREIHRRRLVWLAKQQSRSA